MTWWPKFHNHGFLPNALSLVRGVLGLSLPFFLLQEDPLLHLLAAFLFAVGCLTDYWDGVLARRHGLVSDFGKIVDPLTDKILILTPIGRSLRQISKMNHRPKVW